MKLEKIFKIIEGREWNWFGKKEELEDFGNFINENKLTIVCGGKFSLADLLANKSWCQAVWAGELEEEITLDYLSDSPLATTAAGAKVPTRWNHFSQLTYRILRDQGPEVAIEYIYNTMKK